MLVDLTRLDNIEEAALVEYTLLVRTSFELEVHGTIKPRMKTSRCIALGLVQ